MDPMIHRQNMFAAGVKFAESTTVLFLGTLYCRFTESLIKMELIDQRNVSKYLTISPSIKQRSR